MKQKIIGVPEEVARAVRIGSEYVVDEETYVAKSVYISEEGAEVEIVQEDNAQTSIELDEVKDELGIDLEFE